MPQCTRVPFRDRNVANNCVEDFAREIALDMANTSGRKGMKVGLDLSQLIPALKASPRA